MHPCRNRAMAWLLCGFLAGSTLLFPLAGSRARAARNSAGAAQATPEQIARGLASCLRENLVAWCIVPFDSKKRGPKSVRRCSSNWGSSDSRTTGVPSTFPGLTPRWTHWQRRGFAWMRSGRRGGIE